MKTSVTSAVPCVPAINAGSPGIRFVVYLKQRLQDGLIGRKPYIDGHGEDMPEIRNWKWDWNKPEPNE